MLKSADVHYRQNGGCRLCYNRCGGARTFLSAERLEASVEFEQMKSRDGRKLLRTGMSALRQQCRILILGIVFAAEVCLAGVENLRCEYLTNPSGIDATEPRLSWIRTSSRRGEKQTAYQILVASSRDLLNKEQGDLWDSGKVGSGESSQISYAGRSLTSRQSCFWKVRIWDGDGNCSRWSAIGQWQMGLLHGEDWSAKWVTAQAPASFSTARLIIHRATYGDEKGEDAADVTSTLASYVKQNCLTLVVNNKTLGADPAHNRAKHLRVDYEFEGQPGTREVRENETLMIPEELARLPYSEPADKKRRAVCHGNGAV